MTDRTKKTATAGILLAIVFLMQLIKNVSAFISGPVINTVLVIAILELGIWWGIGFSVLVPLTSMLFAPASPMTMLAKATYGATIPIIIIGNIIFVVIAYLAYKKGFKAFILGLVLGAVLKWLFMWGGAELIIKPLFPGMQEKLIMVIGKIFSTLQLYSGLLSIVIICPVVKALNMRKNEE